MGSLQPQLFVLGSVGLVAGAALFVRGLVAYRRRAVVTSIATSSADSIAAGEVRLSGIVEPLAATLISPLQSVPSVWYHGRVTRSGDTDAVLLDEERSVEFLLRDATGTVRVVPRGARFRIAPALDESTDLFGTEPAGLSRRVGAASMAVAEFDRDAAIADLLTVRPATAGPDGASDHTLIEGSFATLGIRPAGPRRHYVEQRLEPGAHVTLVGFARPYGEVDPLGDPDAAAFRGAVLEDQQIAAELAEARAAGRLAGSAREAWGNAAIPGFGIGRPTETPALEVGAQSLPAAEPAQVDRAERIFQVAPETIVITSGAETPLTIYAGTPVEAATYDRTAFLRGLAGGGLAATSAVVLAVTLNGGL
jgi:hypothetical protein